MKTSFKPLTAPQFTKVYRTELEPSVLHPVGKKVEDGLPLELEFRPDGAGELDLDWINGFLGQTAEFEAIVKEAFQQYCGPKWGGAAAQKEVLEEIGDVYGKGELAHFKKHGYPPYFEIQSITFHQATQEVLISGKVELDSNLAEHGVSIRVAKGKVHFGYGGERGGTDEESDED